MAEKALIFYAQSNLLFFHFSFFFKEKFHSFLVWIRSQSRIEKVFCLTKGLTSFVWEELHIGYPLPKIDIIGVENIDALAMENWGIQHLKKEWESESENESVYRKNVWNLLVKYELCSGALIFANDYLLVNEATPFQRKQRIAR
jgi:hypothetical protein